MSDLVVVGLGYVGLPLVVEASRSGLSVVGLDLDTTIVEGLNAGRSHVDDLSDADIADVVAKGFVATTDASVVADAGAVVICVPTPLDEGGGPDLRAVEGACRGIGEHLTAGTLVVLESTTYPGTTAEIVAPILEKTSGLDAVADFHVAYSPERIDPGNATYGLKNTPKVVGADTPAARDAVEKFYQRFVDTVVVARGTREAESAKLLENTYRHVNIALVNEMAQFFHELEIDFWDIIRLASTKPFGFQAFYPGPGVGGHCIPIDPNYLNHRVRSQLGIPFRFVELAQEINAAMPSYVASRSAELLNEDSRAVRGSTILLLGVTYKPNIADQRESPAVAVAKRLLSMGANVEYHDPHVEKWHVDGVKPAAGELLDAVSSADLVVLLQNHTSYDIDAIAGAAKRLLDTKGATSDERSTRL